MRRLSFLLCLVRLAAVVALAGPAAAQSMEAIGADLFSNPYDIEENGDVAYLLYPSGFVVLDVRTPLRPELFSSGFLPGEAGDLLLRGGYLYVSRGSGGLFTMSVEDPFRPVIVDTIAAPSSFGRMDHGWDRLHVADRDSGLIVIDLQDPGSPERLYKYAVGEPIQDIQIRRAVAYLALERGGLRSLDISHYIPVPLADLTALDGALHIGIESARLYVSRGTAGISAVDIGDSTNPVVLTDAYDPDSAVGDIAAVDSFLVAVHDARELHLLRRGDLSSGPLAVSAGDSTLGRVLVTGERVYTTGLDAGLRLVEVVIPDNATYISGLVVPELIVSSIAVEGDTAYLGAARGVILVSLVNELEPESLRILPTLGTINALSVKNKR
ncbi:MAG: hypothetical protein ABIH26_01935, partial [Candidatus Eisenbacteria bacterium]